MASLTNLSLVVDSNILVALLNPLDHRRKEAVALQQAIEKTAFQIVYFDCVIAEALSATLRRLEEKGDTSGVQDLFRTFATLIAHDQITWVLPFVPELFNEILALIQSSSGVLNFHDTLIALACREQGIRDIVSFDADFDQVDWLHRVSTPSDIVRLNLSNQ